MKMSFDFTDLAPTTVSFRDDVIVGLTQQLKKTSPMHLYDERGSQFFEQICELEEYYVTRAEMEIFDAAALHISEALPSNCTIVEYGSGSDRKISQLLKLSKRIKGYVPIDISKTFLLKMSKKLWQNYPHLDIHAICANFLQLDTDHIAKIIDGYNPVVFFPGSSIGNLSADEITKLLMQTKKIIGGQGKMILGIDLQKTEEVLLQAYDDSKGVTALFNKNLIHRMNRELQTNIDANCFKHHAIYNENKNRIEMHLKALQDLHFWIGDYEITLQKNETIHTESSQKYNVDDFSRFLNTVGFKVESIFFDTKKYFVVLLLALKK